MLQWIKATLGLAQPKTTTICERVIEILVPSTDTSAMLQAAGILDEKHRGNSRRELLCVEVCLARRLLNECHALWKRKSREGVDILGVRV